ncbi:glycosyltransferase family A protein [Acaryochloris marina]|uniref:glycosyltransferase family 2 protein n=1 Tax=Acaryochloris marina TaxID=155978 RepID=UPI001BAF4F9D|nr:glycosyltransferase family A protein [Acaryochloris marina]QUY42731.1 glycosyltransferase family 2 protein [Acaryochloris marina S15]
MNNSLISVIIPAYNASEYIGRTLTSVINQSYQNFEILVVDDGSTDETASIASHFAELDSRIMLIQQANQGVASARNHGIKVAQGEYIAPLDADDIWHKDNLKKKFQMFLMQEASVGMVYSWSADIDELGYFTGHTHVARYFGNVLPGLCLSNFIGNASSTMIRSKCFNNIGGYSTELKDNNAQGAEDWDLYIRLAICYQVQVIPEVLVGYRQLTNGMSKNTVVMMKSQYLTLKRLKDKLAFQCPMLERRISSSHLSVMTRQFYEEEAFDQALAHFIKAIWGEGLITLLPFRNWRLLLKILSKLFLGGWLTASSFEENDAQSPSFLICRPITKYLDWIFNLFADNNYTPIQKLSEQIYPAGQEVGVLPWRNTILLKYQFLKQINTLTGQGLLW